MTQTAETRDAPGFQRRLVLLWIVGAVLRVGFVWLEPATRPIADETMWLMSLNRIPAASFSPFANYPIFHPPLYPYFLAAVNAVFGSLVAIKIAQALIGSLLIPAVGRLAARLFGVRAGFVSAALVTFYPEFIWYAAHFWCETLLLSFFWWGLERVTASDVNGSARTAAAAGLLFGLAVLTRETVLYLLPLAALWLGYTRPLLRVRLAGALMASALVMVVPWTVRNWFQFNAFIPVSTGGGLNLYQGNAEISRGEVYVEYYANEGKVDQYVWARSEGLKAIWRRQPYWILEKVRDEGPRLAELDSLALIHMRRRAYEEPTCGEYRAAATIVLLPWLLVAVAAALGLSRLRLDRSGVFIAGLIASYLMLHIATHGFSRYRLPVMPGFMILAGTLFEKHGADHGIGRRVLLFVLVLGLALLWSPSLLDQLGNLGFMKAPTYEGFAPLCGS